MKKILALLIVCAVLMMVTSVFAQEVEKAKTEASKFQYVGIKKCKTCHKGEKRGKQLELWQERSHSKAYATLATTEAKEAALEAGVKGDPQKAKECLVCHVTAFNVPDDQKEVTLTLEEGVSCEACHGPGSKYKSMKVMKDIYAGTAKGADFGLIKPTEEVCVSCHNEKSPTYKKFVYEEAVKKIAHPVPKKEEK